MISAFMNRPVFKATLHAAFLASLPILLGFIILGIAYGIYMRSLGFDVYYPIIMALVIFAGSVEFIAASLLIGAFNPIHAFFITLMVSARQIFYGISMLDKYHQTSKKKFYLISATIDESFAILYQAKPQPPVDAHWFMVFVTIFLHIYWVTGATLGAIIADFLPFSLQGSEFAMTALFLVIFLEQWLKEPTHESSIIGVSATLIALLLFKEKVFLIPAMIAILILLTVRKKFIQLKFSQSIKTTESEHTP